MKVHVLSYEYSENYGQPFREPDILTCVEKVFHDFELAVRWKEEKSKEHLKRNYFIQSLDVEIDEYRN